MASIEEQTLAQVTETNRLLGQLARSPGGLGGGGSMGGGSSSSGGSMGGDAANKINSSLGSISNGFVKLAEGSMNAGNAVTMFSNILAAAVPGIGKSLGAITQDLGGALIKTNDNMNEAGKVGANWNNNLGEYNRAITGARMTQEEYNRMMKDGASALSGVGSTINRSQANWLEMDKQLQESGVANQLKKMGLSAEEVSQVALASAANRKGLDLSTVKAQKEAVEAAINLTAAMEETTRITGLSRQAQVDDLAARTKNATIQATLMEMDQDKFNQYQDMQVNLRSLGPVVQDVADEIMSGGIRTKEGADKMASLGTAGVELEKAVRLQMAATTDQQKQDAKIALDKAHAAVDEQMHSKQYLDTARVAVGGFADQTRAGLTGNLELGAALAKKQEAYNESRGNISMEEARAGQVKEVQQNMAGKNAEGRDFGDQSKLGTTINEVNRAFKDATAGVATDFGKLSEATGRLIGKQNTLADIIQPRTQEEGGIKNTIAGALTVPADHFSKTLEKAYADSPASNKKNTPEEMAAPVVPAHRASGSPTFENFLNGSGGFKDMFENFDPKGSPAELHGNELVATESQMRRFVEKLIPADLLTNMNKKAGSSMPAATDTADIKANAPAAPTVGTAAPVDDGSITTESKTTSGTPDELAKTFASVTASMQGIVKELTRITEKLAVVNFSDITSKFNEQVTKTFDKINPNEIVKQATAAAKPPEVKPPEVKPPEVKPPEVKPAVVNADAKSTNDIIQSRLKELDAEAQAKFKNQTDAALPKPAEPVKPVEKPMSAIETAFKASSDKMTALIEKMNPGAKVPEFKPVDIEKPKTISAKPVTTAGGLKDARDEMTNAEMQELETGEESTATIKKQERDGKLKFFNDKIAELKGRKDEDAIHDLPIVEAQQAQFAPKAALEAEKEKKEREETLAKEKKERESATVKEQQTKIAVEPPKMPDVSKLNESLTNMAKFNQALKSGDLSKIGMAQMDLSESSKAAEKKLGPSAASAALIKKREALENASFDFEEMKAANTKPSAEAAERLAKKKEEVSKIALAYEEDLIKIKGRLKEHGEESVKNAVIKNKKDDEHTSLQVSQALLAEKKFMAEHGPGSEKKKLPEPPEKPTTEQVFPGKVSQEKATSVFEDLGSSISGMFKSSNKPAFASGNVKYEDVAQETPEENAARLKAMNTPEAIAARRADEDSELNKEIDRQKNSGMYKPNPNLKDNIKSPEPAKAEVKATPHVGGFESFKEFNTRLDAELTQSRSQIKPPSTTHTPLSPIDMQRAMAQAKPPEVPVVPPKPQEQPPTTMTVKEVTLKDLHDVLMQLNKHMIEMAHHTDKISTNSHKQVSATRNLSQDRMHS